MKKLALLIFILTVVNAQSKWSFLSTVPTSPNVSTISIVNSNVIWACATASKVYRSVDGGVTWVLRNGGIPAATDLYGLSALDTSNCWVGTIGGSIYRTSNGGLNWTLQLAVAGSFTNGIKMFSPTYGIYYGDPTGIGQPYQFRYTTNGGTAWVLSPSAPIAASEFGVINAWDWLDTSRIWIGSANTVSGATSANIFRTVNGYRGTFLTTSVTGTGGTAGLYYQAIGFLDALKGMAGSNAGNIRKTTDGGASYQVTNGPSGISPYAAINMNGLKDGSNIVRMSVNIATDTNFTFRTTNLGTTWKSEPLPAIGITNGIQHMQFINSALGYSGGNAGTMMKYQSINVNMKVIIQGLYNTSTDQLNLTDTVRAYLRNNTSPYAVVDSALALIDSTNFTGYFIFDNAASGTYYIQIKYRSGIETWSKTGGEAYTLGSVNSYDFTPAASRAFGNNMALVDGTPVRYGIFSGDVDQDGSVDLTDVIAIYNASKAFVTGYVNTDVNGDDITDLSDIIIANNNSSAFVQKVIPS